MAVYTKKEFAELCKQGTNYLSVQIKRKKVVLNKQGNIDTANEINKAYLEKIYGRMDFVPTDIPKPAKAASKSKQNDEDAIPDDLDDEGIEALLSNPDRKNMSYPELERIYKYLQGKKIERDMEKTQLQIEKTKGIVVPSDLIKPVFLQHNQFVITEFKNASDEIIRIISKKKGLSINEVAEIRGDLVKCINESINKATISSLKNVTNIINDYSQTRGVGERM